MNTFKPHLSRSPTHETYQHQDSLTIRENIFTCLFSFHNTIRLSRDEQVTSMLVHSLTSQYFN